MSTDEYEHWKALEIRRPDDVRTIPGGPVPLRWQVDKHGEHADRLWNLGLPADFKYEVERGNAGDVLAVLALGVAMQRDIGYSRGHRVHEAMTLGATWTEVATALDVTPEEARDLLRSYAAGQRQLHEGDVQEGRARPFGMDADQLAAVLALCALDDDTAAAEARDPK